MTARQIIQTEYNLTIDPNYRKSDALPDSVLSMKCRGIFVEFLRLGFEDIMTPEQRAGLTNHVAFRVDFKKRCLHNYVGVLYMMKVNFDEKSKGSLRRGNLILSLLEGPNKPKGYDSVCTLIITNTNVKSPSLENIMHVILVEHLYVFRFEKVDNIYRGSRDFM